MEFKRDLKAEYANDPTFEPWWVGKFPLIGFKVVNDAPRAPRELVDRFNNYFVPDLADWVGTLYTMDSAIRPMYTPMRRVIGSALTVKMPPGDNLMVKKAFDMAQEGDVVVIDARGHTHWCCGGGGMCVAIEHKGVAGVVVDGAWRDMTQIRAIDFPLFCRGIAPNTGPKRGPGEVNVPISCGGVIVNPGDIIVGDEEGVVVIPLQYAQRIIDKLGDTTAKYTKEDWQVEKMMEREVARNAFYERMMKQKGCEFVGGSNGLADQ